MEEVELRRIVDNPAMSLVRAAAYLFHFYHVSTVLIHNIDRAVLSVCLSHFSIVSKRFNVCCLLLFLLCDRTVCCLLLLCDRTDCCCCVTELFVVCCCVTGLFVVCCCCVTGLSVVVVV